MCLIAQVSSITSHRLALNHGFQINYGLPFQLSSYYSPIFWARTFSNSSNLFVNFFERMAASDDIAGAADEDIETTTLLDDETTSEEPNERRKRAIQSDMSAGQFYASISEVLG
jgi:hypothetical protein